MAKRVNPFIGVGQDGIGPGARDLAQDAADAKFGRLYRVFNREAIKDGRTAVNMAKADLLAAHEVVANVPNGQVASKEALQALEETGRKFNLARNQHGYELGKLWPSIKGAVREMLNKIGIDANGIGAGKLRGDVHKAVLNTYETKAGFLERLASKPFRVAANYPGPALLVTGIGALALGGTYIKNRAEKRTAREAQEAMMRAQAEAMAATQQPQPTYKNTVTHADMEAINARMAADGKATPAFAADVAAAKAQAPATSVA